MVTVPKKKTENGIRKTESFFRKRKTENGKRKVKKDGKNGKRKILKNFQFY